MAYYIRGDKVVVYEGDLLQRPRHGTIVKYQGLNGKGQKLYTVRWNGIQSVVSEQWIRRWEPPTMDDTRSYLETLHAVQDLGSG